MYYIYLFDSVDFINVYRLKMLEVFKIKAERNNSS